MLEFCLPFMLFLDSLSVFCSAKLTYLKLTTSKHTNNRKVHLSVIQPLSPSLLQQYIYSTIATSKTTITLVSPLQGAFTFINRKLLNLWALDAEIDKAANNWLLYPLLEIIARIMILFTNSVNGFIPSLSAYWHFLALYRFLRPNLREKL